MVQVKPSQPIGAERKRKKRLSLLPRFASFVVVVSSLAFFAVNLGRSPALKSRDLQEMNVKSEEGEPTTRYETEAGSGISGPITLTYERPEKKYGRTNFTRDQFIVNGVNLAQYAFEKTKDRTQTVHLTEYYELFEDWSVEKLIGRDHPGYMRLHKFRRADLKDLSLSFYGDKVASQRTRVALGVPQVKKLALRYRHELKSQGDPTSSSGLKEVLDLIPKDASYVAKNSHLTTAWGVHVVKYNAETKKQSFLFSRQPDQDENYQGENIIDYNETRVAESLLVNLRAEPGSWESYSLTQIKPGFIVEERFTQPGENDKVPAFEFDVFTVWGKVLFAYFKTGNEVSLGYLDHNGKPLADEDHGLPDEIPDWVDWSKVVELAETMAAHKDFLRVDIFVGIGADDAVLRLKDPNHPETRAKQKEAVKVVLNEVEFLSTCIPPKFARKEAARLWVAGYKMGIYKNVPNSDVPPAFVQKGYLSEEDLAEWVQHRMITK